MSRNSNSIITNVPTNRKPRTRIDMGVIDILTSSQHGRLVPNFIAPVYPGDTWTNKDFAGFARADKSLRVPLQNVEFDQYFFFVPFRIIDKNFEKVLGARDNPYDDNIYEMKQVKFDFSYSTEYSDSIATVSGIFASFLPSYLGWSAKDLSSLNDEQGTAASDTYTAYPLMAYWKIYNDFFRDENLHASIDLDTAITNISNASIFDTIMSAWENDNQETEVVAALENLHLLPERVSRFHDLFSSGMITPQKSPDGQPVTLFLGGAAPLKVGDLYTLGGITGTNAGIKLDTADGLSGGSGLGITGTTKTVVSAGGVPTGTQAEITKTNLYADLSEATAVDVNALRLAFAIQSLYETKGRFGSRYIEYIRGIWSVSVPDAMLERPEYLGGCHLTMNNMPIIDTASQLGTFSGYSATLFDGANFDKTFLEYGYIIGVHCERIRHIMSQGLDTSIWRKRVELDLYNPKFAELGFMGYPKELSVHIPGADTNSEVFNYNEAWSLERALLSRVSGIFSPLNGSSYQEFREKWTYVDYYDEVPSFNANWLNEPTENVARTLTGSVIAGATNAISGHQYMFDFKFHFIVTRIIPVYSTPAELGGRW